MALHAQSTKVELSGVVRDPAGLPIEGAEVRLSKWGPRPNNRCDRRRWQISLLRSAAGHILDHRHEKRLLRVEAGGVVLRVGDQVSLDLALSDRQRHRIRECHRGSAVAPVQPRHGEFRRGAAEGGHPATRRPELHSADRAVSGGHASAGITLPRINGSRPRVSEYIYDGISVLQPEPGQVAYFPVVDAIEEFRVETNSYSAEYGRSNGGVIMVNHKVGLESISTARLFEFFRNEALNARNLFATTGPKPRFRRNQYGFVFGGPIQRNKTFFFVDYQGTRLQTGTVRTSTVPTTRAAARSLPHADFRSRDDTADAARYSCATGFPTTRSRRIALTRQLERCWTAIRFPMCSSTGRRRPRNNYVRVGNETTDQEQFGVRLDHNLNSTQRIFGRYAYLRDDSRPGTPLPDGSGSHHDGRHRRHADSRRQRCAGAQLDAVAE